MRLFLTLALLPTLLIFAIGVSADNFLPGVNRKMQQMLLHESTLNADETTDVSAASSAPIHIGGFSTILLFATTSSGTFTTAVIELQGSPDTNPGNFVAFTPPMQVTGEGHIVASNVPFRYVRAHTKTAQGATSQAEVFIQAK